MITYENITLEDCVEMYEMKEMAAIIRGGQVVEFREETEPENEFNNFDVRR